MVSRCTVAGSSALDFKVVVLVELVVVVDEALVVLLLEVVKGLELLVVLEEDVTVVVGREVLVVERIVVLVVLEVAEPPSTKILPSWVISEAASPEVLTAAPSEMRKTVRAPDAAPGGILNCSSTSLLPELLSNAAKVSELISRFNCPEEILANTV